MKYLVCMFSVLLIATELEAQKTTLSANRLDIKQRQIIDDLADVIRVCGCTNCGGLPMHNNPFGDVNGFTAVTRWSATAMSGGGLQLGDPTIITWSIIPDGTDANGNSGFVPSNLIAVFDDLFDEVNAGTPDLTNRFWHTLIEQALNRWGEVSGIEYMYEPNDDGAANFGAGGFSGVRGDVRIGGFTIDGPGNGQSNTLAFNRLPDVGDMAIDTFDRPTYGASFASFRLFRNVFTHEQGHGLGLLHVESNNASFLMEPFIQDQFDGPQLDDIRGVHALYGDAFEKENNFAGNNSIANATQLGLIQDQETATIGLDGASGTFVASNDSDFISIDNETDVDFISFVVDEIVFANLTLTPVGANYNQSAEGGGGNVPINTSSTNNLDLALFNASGGLLDFSSSSPAGSPETISNAILIPGTYTARVTGQQNSIQLYTFSVNIQSLGVPDSTAPSSVGLTTGTVRSGDAGDLLTADGQYLELNPSVPGDPATEPIFAQFVFTSPNIQPSEFSVSYEGSGNSANLFQELSVLDNSIGQFVEFDSRVVEFEDDDFTITPDGTPTNFVSFPSGLVLIQAKYSPTGPVFMYPWTVRIDRFVINTLD